MAIVVVIEKTCFSVSDASRAIQSMVLTGWAEGVGSNWVGFFGLEGVKPLLGIPDELDVLAIVPFGYPVQSIGKGRKKRVEGKVVELTRIAAQIEQRGFEVLHLPVDGKDTEKPVFQALHV